MCNIRSMKKCRLTAAEPTPVLAPPASFGSLPAFPSQMAHDFHHVLTAPSVPLSRTNPSRRSVSWVCGTKSTPIRHEHAVAPLCGLPSRLAGCVASRQVSNRPASTWLTNDRNSSPTIQASAPSPSHAFGHRTTPLFEPETRLKRIETTLKWLETLLKRLEINVETLKRFKQFKTSTSLYQRLTQTEPLKRENFCNAR